PDALADVLHGFAVRKLFESLPILARKVLVIRRRNEKLHLWRQHSNATPAVAGFGPILHQSAGLTADYFAILILHHRAVVCGTVAITIANASVVVIRHRSSSLFLFRHTDAEKRDGTNGLKGKAD